MKPSIDSTIRPFSKLHLLAKKIALFGTFVAKFFGHVYSHALKILPQIPLKMTNFIKQSKFLKNTIVRLFPLELVRQSLCSLKMHFLSSLLQNFLTMCSHILLKFFCKSAQKLLILSSKVHYARGLLFFMFLAGCSHQREWTYRKVISDYPEFDSGQLKY